MKVLRRCLGLASSLAGAVAFAQSSVPLPGSPQAFFAAVPATPPADLSGAEGRRYLRSLHAVGRNDLHAALGSQSAPPQPCEAWPGPDARPFVDVVAELAAGTSIVIVNEAHDQSRHREITRALAIALREKGYTYFAAEAFSPRIDRYPLERFVRTDAGHHVLDPTFGQLVRTAKELGFNLVPYEHGAAPGETAEPVASIRERAEGQANNLVARIFAKDAAAKVLIHVGYANAAEVAVPTLGEDVEWLAARLKAKTGVDPLTIDQVQCATAGEALAVTHSSPDVPVGAYDIAIAHPGAALFRGRPQWRIDAGDIAIELPEPLAGADVRTLVEARYESEPVDTVPIDRLLLSPGERLPLLLRPGRIRIVQNFEDGRAPNSFVLNVR